MDHSKFKDKDLYDKRTGFGKRLPCEQEQKTAVAWHVAGSFAKYGDLAMFIAEGTTAGRFCSGRCCRSAPPAGWASQRLWANQETGTNPEAR